MPTETGYRRAVALLRAGAAFFVTLVAVAFRAGVERVGALRVRAGAAFLVTLRVTGGAFFVALRTAGAAFFFWAGRTGRAGALRAIAA